MNKKDIIFTVIIMFVISISVSGITVYAATYYKYTAVNISETNYTTVQNALSTLKGYTNGYGQDITKFNQTYNKVLTNKVGSGEIRLICKGSICYLRTNSYNPGNITARTVIAEIESGYRPPTEVYGANYQAMTNYVGIRASGEVWIESTAKNTYQYNCVTYPRWQ